MVWRTGDLCVAKSSQFDEFYNAKIMRLDGDRMKALVQFIEYGESEEVPVAHLKPFGEFAINKAGDLVKGEQRSGGFGWPGGWKVGDVCIAWWEEDKTWNNANILKIFSSEEVFVMFTDFGNADFTSLKNLKAVGGAGDEQQESKERKSSATKPGPKSNGDCQTTVAKLAKSKTR